MKKISRRTFVSQSSALVAAGMTPACVTPESNQQPELNQPSPIPSLVDRANRENPSEGLQRENITITDIKLPHCPTNMTVNSYGGVLGFMSGNPMLPWYRSLLTKA